MIIENELLLLFLIEIHTDLQRIYTAKNQGNSRMTSFFHLFFRTSSVSGIDLYLKIFKINFRVVPSDLKSA